VLLNRGRLMGSFAKNETTLAELTQMMAGGEELERLSKELETMATEPELEQVARELAQEAGTG
jgi:simple sugar transport system ATP-binding protein